MMINGIVMAVLMVESITDLKKRTLPVIRLILYFISGIAANLIFSYQPLSSVLGGIGVGISVLLFGLLTNEGIGYGDGLLFVCIGTVIGFSKNIELLFFSLLFAGITGSIYALIRKKGTKVRLPFVPCITGVFAIMTIMEKVI